MKYEVRSMGENTFCWVTEDDEGNEHIVNFMLHKDKFICDCIFNTLTDLTCKHIRMVKQYILNGKREFE